MSARSYCQLDYGCRLLQIVRQTLPMAPWWTFAVSWQLRSQQQWAELRLRRRN